MFSVAVENVKQNPTLLAQLKKLFCSGDDEVQLLFNSIVERYYNMGCRQYLRDFQRDYNIQKTEAHRKKVTERKTKRELKEDKKSL